MINVINPLRKLSETNRLIMNSVNKFCRNELPSYLKSKQYNSLRWFNSNYEQVNYEGGNEEFWYFL